MTVNPDLHLDFKQALTQLLLAGKVVAVLLHTAIAVRVLQGNWDERFLGFAASVCHARYFQRA